MSPGQGIVTCDRNRFGNGAELPDRSKGLVVVVALSQAHGVLRISFFRLSSLALGTLALNAMALGACSSGSSRASAEFCSLGRDAARWYIDFDDDEAIAALVEHPGLKDDDRAAVRAAVNDARAQTAGGDGWSNDRMTAAINDICDLNLTPVTMVP